MTVIVLLWKSMTCFRCKTCYFVSKTPSVSFLQRLFKKKKNIVSKLGYRSLTWESRNFIYGRICKRHSKVYVKETGRKLEYRFGEHFMENHNKAAKSVSLLKIAHITEAKTTFLSLLTNLVQVNNSRKITVSVV